MRWKMYGLIAAVALGIYGCAYFYSTLESAEDAGECAFVADSLASQRSIPPSISVPGQPGVFCDMGIRLPFLTRFDHVRVYGVVDRPNQEAIIAELRRVRRQSKTRAILVQFFEKENWRVTLNPAPGIIESGSRGPERSIREVYIK